MCNPLGHRQVEGLQNACHSDVITSPLEGLRPPRSQLSPPPSAQFWVMLMLCYDIFLLTCNKPTSKAMWPASSSSRWLVRYVVPTSNYSQLIYSFANTNYVIFSKCCWMTKADEKSWRGHRLKGITCYTQHFSKIHLRSHLTSLNSWFLKHFLDGYWV